jgi:hypothetical protein
MKINTHEKSSEHEQQKRGCGRLESPNHIEKRDISMKTKRLTTNQPMQTQKKERKMSDNFKFSVKHNKKQTKSLWAKRLGNLQAHKWNEKRMKKRPKKPLNKR